MKTRVGRFIVLGTVKFLVTCVAFLRMAHAQIPVGWESYLQRPDVLALQAQSHDLGTGWDTLKEAHFSMLASLLSLYPQGTHFYFLARDSEHLFDAARLVTQGTPDSERMHLLNVSRANMNAAGIKAYLAQNGITEEALAAGKRVVFVDTGFAGTIPRVIGENFSAQGRERLKTHLIASSNPEHPSTRAFLIHLNPRVNEVAPASLHASIVSYEHMSRYTDRSSRYLLMNGTYHPISPIGQSIDGSVSKETAIKVMQDLKAHWQKPETRARFHAERVRYHQILKLLIDPSEQARQQLKTMLAKDPGSDESRQLEAQIRDALEAKVNLPYPMSHGLTDLGLEIVRTGANASKHDLIKKYPEWAAYLEDPVSKIPELFQKQNWQMIGNLVDANVDAEINGILARLLFDAPAQGIKKQLQESMINVGNPDVLDFLASHVFNKPMALEMKDLVRLTIQKAEGNLLETMARSTFLMPHAAQMQDLIKLLIEKGDERVLEVLARYAFSAPHAMQMQDLMKLIVEKGTDRVLKALIEYSLSAPHAPQLRETIKLVINKGSEWTLALLAGTFVGPKTLQMQDLMKLLAEKGGPRVTASLAVHTFALPHSAQMHDTLRFLIEKADQDSIRSIAKTTFSYPHIAQMHDLLPIIVEKALQDELSRDLLTQWDIRNPAQEFMFQAFEIRDPAQRRAWMASELSKLGPPRAALPISRPGMCKQVFARAAG